MIKVAYVLPNLNGDGGQTVVCTLIRNLDKTKYLPKLFVLSSKVDNKLLRKLKAADIEVKFLNLRYDYQYIRMFEIIYNLDRSMKLFQPDVINVHLDILYSWIWAFIRNKRIIFTVHSEASRISSRFTLKLFSLLNRKKLIRVTSVSAFAAESFKDVFGTENIDIIYNPVEIHIYNSFPKVRHEGINFINVARFYPVKNHTLLIDAFALVCQKTADAKLYLVGNGPEYEKLKRYVLQNKLETRVIFTGYCEDVASLLTQSDVFVLSSLSEAFPVSVIEALAAGLPVIATNVGGLPELVNDNGILVASNNVNSLCDAMLLLAADSRLRNEMGKISQEKSKIFDVSNIVKQYEDLYKRCMR